MKLLARMVAGPVLFLLTVVLPISSSAHSLKGVEETLQEEEPGAQLVNEPAPTFSLQDLDGQPWVLSDQGGKTLILNFVYARCQDICPIHMALIGELQQMINAAQMQDQVQFVTVATDTEDAAETAEVMRTYQERYGLDPVNWTFVYGGENDPGAGKRIADQYGLTFTQTEDGAQVHGAVTHVIDREGQMRARFHGLEFKPINLVGYTNTLVYDFHPGSGDHHAVAEESSAETGISLWRLIVVGAVLVGVLIAAYIGVRRLLAPTKK